MLLRYTSIVYQGWLPKAQASHPPCGTSVRRHVQLCSCGWTLTLADSLHLGCMAVTCHPNYCHWGGERLRPRQQRLNMPVNEGQVVSAMVRGKRYELRPWQGSYTHQASCVNFLGQFLECIYPLCHGTRQRGSLAQDFSLECHLHGLDYNRTI